MSFRTFSRAAITQRLFNSPLAVTPDTAAIVLGAVGERFDVSQLFVAAEGRHFSLGDLEQRAAAERDRLAASASLDQRGPLAAASALMFVAEGVAHVQIRGELIAENDGSVGPSSGFTGYDGIRAQVLAADRDPEVRGILLDIDSPGGEVAGLNELTSVLMARRGAKPMRAVIRGIGASAAYAIACCADDVTVQPLSFCGSIGVIAMHADFSGMLEQDGVKVTLIVSGAHKADGNPFEPLPPDVRERMEGRVMRAADSFFAHVSTARGLSEADVRGQEAQIFHGEEAVAAGLADKVMSWVDAIDEFVAQVNDPGAGGAGANGLAASAAGGGKPGARTARASQENVMSEQSSAPAADNAPEFTQTTQEAAITAALTAERARVGELFELDADSNASPALTAAIANGTSAGEFAIGLQKASRQQQAGALADVKADAARADDLPQQRSDASANTNQPNRGAAAVERMRGKHPGLPAKG